MFTGIIEEIGTLKSIRKAAHSAVLEINADLVLNQTRIGDSISVNGVCLTVTGISGTSFAADAMPETMNRSNLYLLKSNDRVNLERALLPTSRLGGHFVSGHIDGTGLIESFREDENAIWITISAESSLLRYIIEKGSVALDGISLTVASVSETDFTVSVIPHTRNQTTLCSKRIREKVNIECDLIGKYIEKLMKPESNLPPSGGLTMEKLKENGFF